MNNDKILEAINNSIDIVLSKRNLKEICHEILLEMVHVTNDTMAFVAELKYSTEGSPFFRYQGVVFKSDVSSFKEYYKKYFLKSDNLDFYNMDTLHGVLYNTKTTVISNDVMNDVRRKGDTKFPKGHPHINRFMGIPLIYNDNLIGMIGVSEPESGKDYTEADLKYIEPFCKLFIFAFVYWKRKEAINSSRNYFLLHMSHEIKTPLNGILGMTQSFLDTNPSEEQVEIITTISQCNLRLLTIVNSIGDLYKITVGQIELNPKPVQINIVLKEVFDIYTSEIKVKNIMLNYEIDPEIKGDILIDKKRLSQILENLLSNAVNNTNRGSITINVTKDLEKTKQYLNDTNTDENSNEIFINFEVKDTGVGIPKDKLDALLHDFSNLEDYMIVNPNTGRGLGLSICSMLVKLLGGELVINSIVDIGTIVSFSVKTEISDNVDVLKNYIKQKMNNTYILVLTNDQKDRIKLSNLIISVGIIPIIPNSINETMIYIEHGSIQFDIVILSEYYIDSDIVMNIKTKQKDMMLIGITSNKKYPYIDKYVSINYSDSDIIKNIHNYCKHKYSVNMVDTEVSLFDEINKSKILDVNPSKTLSYQANQIKILIAEDELANQKVLMAALKRLGYNNIDIVMNGKLMVEYGKKNRYDVLFIDIRMPIMDGLEATKQLIEYYDSELLNYPYMIAVTALEDLNMKERYSSVGIHYILKKPFHFSSLEKIMKIVSNNQKINFD